MKNLWIYILCIPFLLNASNYDLIRKEIEELKQDPEYGYEVHEADETVNGIVKDALKCCNFQRPVIVLQANNTNNAWATRDINKSGQEFIILGTKNVSPGLMQANSFHEIGHLVHEDVEPRCKAFINGCMAGLVAAPIASGIAVATVSKYLHKNPATLILTGMIAGIIGLEAAALSIIVPTFQLMETKADEFAYEQMLKNNRIYPIMSKISDHLKEYDKEGFQIDCIESHPNKFQRAKMGIDMMQAKGIVIADLIKNLPTELDKQEKNDFSHLVKKYFPELATH